MECNVTKQSVYVNECVLNQNLEQPIDTEFTLPDYCPDIDHIIKCVIQPRTGQKSFNGDTLTVDGTAMLTLFYTDGSQIRCYEYPIHFSRQISVGKPLSKASARVCITSEFVNCRAVSKRRVDLHASLNMNVCITSVREQQVVSDIDYPSVQTLPAAASATTPMGIGEKYILFSDEIEVPSTNSPIKTLLRSDARTLAHECKIIGNKVVVKGELIVSFFYISENDNKPEHFTSTMPISQIVDIDRLNDSCTATAEIEINELEIKTHTSATGEVSTLTVSAKMTVTAAAYCNLDIPIVLDAYSTDRAMELERTDIRFKKVDTSVYDNFVCRGNVEFGSDEIGEVLDIWCQPRVSSTEIGANGILVKGIANVNMLAVDTDGYPRFYEKPLEFEYEHPCNIGKCEVTPPQMVAIGCEHSMMPGAAEVRVELSIHTEIIGINDISPLMDAKLSETEIKPKDDFARIALYYPQSRERLWDIARKHNTGVSDIMVANGISGDFAEAGSILIIPQK